MAIITKHTKKKAIIAVMFMREHTRVFCFRLPLYPYFLNGHKIGYILHLQTKQFIYYRCTLHCQDESIQLLTTIDISSFV